MMEALIDRFGEGWLMLATGAGVGLIFGLAAAQSRFCLRAATAEVAEGQLGPKLSIWLIAFCTALAAVQASHWAGWLDLGMARQLAATGSLSGAILGGLMFGSGMILARGCASRLLVPSAAGNLRAMMTGLVLTLTAQAALTGVLAPLREGLAALWTVPGGPARRLVAPDSPAFDRIVVASLLAAALAFAFARHRRVPLSEALAALVVGLAVFGGWALTHAIAETSFDIVAVQSITFTGPSTDTLMALVTARHLPLTFGAGLVPGVVLGAALAAVWRGEARLQRFGPDTPMERYLLGGVLMGFGSMLAGGCAVGAGVTGGALLATTAWLAVGCMWVGAIGTHHLLRQTSNAAARTG